MLNLGGQPSLSESLTDGLFLENEEKLGLTP